MHSESSAGANKPAPSLVSLFVALLAAAVVGSGALPAPARHIDEDADARLSDDGSVSVAATPGPSPAPCGWLWRPCGRCATTAAVHLPVGAAGLALRAAEAARADGKEKRALQSFPAQQMLLHAQAGGRGSGQRQGQVCRVTFDLAGNSFAMTPASLSFRVTTPHARVVLSLYAKGSIELLPASAQGRRLPGSINCRCPGEPGLNPRIIHQLGQHAVA